MSAPSSHMRLEVISGNSTGTTITVEDELVIGRHASGAGRLSEDEELSRQHARVSREVTGDYAIEDLGSSNGTFVNGLRIQSPRLLSLGDSIETGATTLLVREIVQPAPADTSEAADSPASDLPYAPTVFARTPAAGEAIPTPDHASMPAAEPVVPVKPVSPPTPTVPAPSHVMPAALKLEVDFDAREARVALGDGEETVRLVFKDGCWRVSSPELDR